MAVNSLTPNMPRFDTLQKSQHSTAYRARQLPGLAQGQQSRPSPGAAVLSQSTHVKLPPWYSCGFSFPSLARPDNSCSQDKGTQVASYVYMYMHHHLAFCLIVSK